MKNSRIKRYILFSLVFIFAMQLNMVHINAQDKFTVTYNYSEVNLDGYSYVNVNTRDEIKECITEKISNFEEEMYFVSANSFNFDDTEAFIEELQETCPYYAGLINMYGYDTQEYEGYYYYAFGFKYYISEYEEEQVDERVKEIASDMNGMSDYEKIKYAHDYLIDINTYTEGYDGPYNALFTGKVVCNGYALAFCRIMMEVNIDCQYNTGDHHAWNTVKLDGEWYNIDVTWDDRETDTPSYSYFLKSNDDWQDHAYGNATAKDSYDSKKSVFDVTNIDHNSKISLIIILFVVVPVVMIVILLVAIIGRKKKNRFAYSGSYYQENYSDNIGNSYYSNQNYSSFSNGNMYANSSNYNNGYTNDNGNNMYTNYSNGYMSSNANNMNSNYNNGYMSSNANNMNSNYSNGYMSSNANNMNSNYNNGYMSSNANNMNTNYSNGYMSSNANNMNSNYSNGYMSNNGNNTYTNYSNGYMNSNGNTINSNYSNRYTNDNSMYTNNNVNNETQNYSRENASNNSNNVTQDYSNVNTNNNSNYTNSNYKNTTIRNNNTSDYLGGVNSKEDTSKEQQDISKINLLRDDICEAVLSEFLCNGFSENNTVKLAYSISGAAQKLGISEFSVVSTKTITNIMNELEKNVGRIKIVPLNNYLSISVYEEGIRYAAKVVPRAQFYGKVYKELKKPICRLSIILDIFKEESQDVVIEELHAGEYQYKIYYKDTNLDRYKYYFKFSDVKNYCRRFIE